MILLPLIQNENMITTLDCSELMSIAIVTNISLKYFSP